MKTGHICSLKWNDGFFFFLHNLKYRYTSNSIVMLYVDLKSERMAELSRVFVSSSVAGQSLEVSLCGNDLLKWTNHACDIASCIAECRLTDSKKQ